MDRHCQFCGSQDRLIRFYDQLNDCHFLLCHDDFQALIVRRRRAGLWAPNGRWSHA